MEDSSVYNTSEEEHYKYNISLNNDGHVNTTDFSYEESILNVVDWISICFGLPLTLVAIAAVYSLVGKDQVAPVYIINLLVSDLIQLCCTAALKIAGYSLILSCSYHVGLMASVGFMVCISMERYLMITQPLWYRFRRNIQSSLVVCVVVWILLLVIVIPLHFRAAFQLREIIFSVFFLLPFPLFIFSLVGTIKALSAAHSVLADEKRRIVAVLVVVLLIYTLLFLPSIIWSLVEEARKNRIFNIMSIIFLFISPLADMTLYIFIRKGTTDKLLASLCCCSMSTNQMSSRSDDMSASCSQTL